MSTKIHATVDTHGRPTGLLLTGGQKSGLEDADTLLMASAGRTPIADDGPDWTLMHELSAARKTKPMNVAPKQKAPQSNDWGATGL